MTDESFETMRRAMVASQLRTNAVDDPRVIAAMSTVAREAFVPADRAKLAYVDRPVPLGPSRALNPPLALGLLLTAAVPVPSDRTLLIGAASGYTAAVLARMVAAVVAVEEDDDLLASARATLGGTAGIELVAGPLAAGWAAGAPYDLIVIDGAVETVPQAIVEQLGPVGRLVTGVIEEGIGRLAIGRRGGGGFALRAFADAEAVRLPGFSEPAGFRF